MSRHQIGVATPLIPIQVATSKRGRDTISHASPKPGRNTKTRSRPSWRLTYVATSISCRDLVSAHSGISRLQRQNPGHDLPRYHPCRDNKNDVATSNLTCQYPRSPSLRPTATQLGGDTTSWSRPHAQPNQVATSNRCRDLKGPNPQRPLFFWS